MRVGRNEACPCGSGKKYKSCCEGKARRALPKGLIAMFAVLAVLAAIAFVPRGDDQAASTASLPAAPVRRPGPQPPGPVPPGKVWSTEHGHWHDVAAASPANPIQVQQTNTAVPLRTTAGPTPQPPGPVPPGQVWSPEHGHWHDAAPQTR